MRFRPALTAPALAILASWTTTTAGPRPRTMPAEVTIVHEHAAVVECVRAQTTTTPCEARLRAADAATTLVLHHAPAGPNIRSGQVQRTIRVEVGPGIGSRIQVVQLPAGVWSIAWPGAPRRAFQAAAGDRFSISLRTTTGRCQRTPVRCEIVPSQDRTVTIPVSRTAR